MYTTWQGNSILAYHVVQDQVFAHSSRMQLWFRVWNWPSTDAKDSQSPSSLSSPKSQFRSHPSTLKLCWGMLTSCFVSWLSINQHWPYSCDIHKRKSGYIQCGAGILPQFNCHFQMKRAIASLGPVTKNISPCTLEGELVPRVHMNPEWGGPMPQSAPLADSWWLIQRRPQPNID